MNCQQLNERLIEFLDGRLETRQRAEVEAHLAACAACRQRAAEFRSLSLVLEEWQPTEPSAAFDARLAERIESAAASSWRWWLAWMRPAYVAVLALLLVAAGIVIWMQQGSAPAPSPVAVHAPAPVAPNPMPTTAATNKDEEVLLLENLAVLENADMLDDFDVLSEIGRAKVKEQKKKL